MKFILTMLLAFMVSVVSAQQEPSFYKLTEVSAYDVNTGRWSDFKDIDGILGTKGNLVRIEVAEYNFAVQFNLTVVAREEDEEIVLIKYIDVEQQATVWFYHNKTSRESVVRVVVGGNGLQFTVGNPIGNGS